MSKEDGIILEYTPEAALEVLMGKLTRSNSELAASVQTAMDEGKDIQEVEPGAVAIGPVGGLEIFRLRL